MDKQDEPGNNGITKGSFEIVFLRKYQNLNNLLEINLEGDIVVIIDYRQLHDLHELQKIPVVMAQKQVVLRHLPYCFGQVEVNGKSINVIVC